MKIFLVVFATIVLTFVGKGAFAHTNSNSVKSKFCQSLGSRNQYLNAIEEEEISEDLQEEKNKVVNKVSDRFISTSHFTSEAAIELTLSNQFEIIKSHSLALFKQFDNYRI